MPLSEAIGKDSAAIEGLAKDGIVHKVRQAWIANDVPQCGDCQSGMIMSLAALLRSIPNPTDADIDLAIPTSTVAAHSSRFVMPFTPPRTLEGSIMTHVPFVNCCSFVTGAAAVGCANCHDDNWDKRLADSAIMQGHPTGYPVYRLVAGAWLAATPTAQLHGRNARAAF